MSRHRVPTSPSRTLGRLGLLSCVAFYPLSDGLCIHTAGSLARFVPARLRFLHKHPLFALCAWFHPLARVFWVPPCYFGSTPPVGNLSRLTDTVLLQRLYVVRLGNPIQQGVVSQQWLLEYWRIHSASYLSLHAASNPNINLQ